MTWICKLVRLTPLLLLALLSCGGPTHGVVAEKKYKPARDYHTVILVGKLIMLQTIHENESWNVFVECGEGSGWRKVPQSTFDSISIGDSIRFE